MARGRMLNKSVSSDKAVAALINDLGPAAGLVFTWLIAHLDREGRMHGDPEVIKGIVFPRIAGIDPAIIRQSVGKMHELGLVRWYESDGDAYLEMPGFEKNQIGMRKAREPESLFPAPTSIVPTQCVAGNLPADFRQPSGSLPPEWKGMEGNGREVTPLAPSEKIPTTAMVKHTPSPLISTAEVLPTTKDGSFVATDRDLGEWRAAYPGVDVLQALRHMRQWLLADRARLKTPRGMHRFVTGWLARDQNRGRPYSQDAPSLTRKGEEIRKAVQAADPEMFNFNRR